jgi:hypothetical protein
MNIRQRIWNPSAMILDIVSRDPNSIKRYVNPESALEQRIANDIQWQEGAFWGEPRPGHPEGKVIFHIHEVLQNVDKATNDKILRAQLRLITIIHDTFKHLEEQTRPRTDWAKHHSIFALDFAKKYITDKAVLDVIELHDEAYYTWRESRAGRHDKSQERLNNLRERLGNNMQLFYLFFKSDTQTGDKYQSPVTWFEKALEKEITVVNF